MDEGTTPSACRLPDELVVEILARLPANSLCRFKSVSRSWHGLISDPAHRTLFAQTLSGCFFHRRAGSRPPWGFVGLTALLPGNTIDSGHPTVDTALTFLHTSCRHVELLDSCNGLVLLRCSGSPRSARRPRFYVVCNPATGEWVALPQPSLSPSPRWYGDPGQEYKRTCYAALGFDQAVSSHFHVFQLVEKELEYEYFVNAMEIYSSETGRWVLCESKWSKSECMLFTGHMTYFNGLLHFTVLRNAVASVDTKGQVCMVTHLPHCDERYGHGFIGHSQGRLLCIEDKGSKDDVLSVYALEDQNSEECTLKQTISKLDLFGPRKPPRGENYCVVAFHPNSNLIFFYDWSRERLMSYGMDYNNVRFIGSLREVKHGTRPFVPYVPLYSRALSSSPNVN